MMQEDIEGSVCLQAKLKAQILKQIFKDLGPKNLKGVEFFYLIVKKELIEMQFTSSSRDIMITIILKNNLFQHYQYNKQRASLHKYALEDFTGIGFMFENNKLLLQLHLTDQRTVITSVSGKGYTQFVAVAMNCDQDDEDFLINDQDMRPNQRSSMELRLAKVGLFQGILSYAKACKLNVLWFRFQSCKKMLQVTDKPENHELRWFLNVQESRLFNFDHHMPFHLKALACALNLLPNDSELVLTFYDKFVLLDVPEKQKSFTIRLNTKQQEGL